MSPGTRVRYVRWHARLGRQTGEHAETGTVQGLDRGTPWEIREVAWDLAPRGDEYDEIQKTDLGWELCDFRTSDSFASCPVAWSTVEPLDLPVVQRDYLADVLCFRERLRSLARAMSRHGRVTLDFIGGEP